MQGAKIDVWGIGTRLITAYDQPALGCVYKLVSIEDENGVMVDTMKISNNAEKVSTPGKKQVWRITRNSDGKSEGDYIALWDERPDQLDELFMFHPVYTYINKTVKDFTARPILQPIFNNGKLVYELPNFKRLKRTKTSKSKAMGRIQTYLEPRAISSRPLSKDIRPKIGKYCGNQRRSAS